MNVNFNGYDEKVLTFSCDDSVKSGMPVKLSGNGAVRVCETGDTFIGVALSVRDGYAAVQTGGYIQITSAGSIGVGYQKLSADKDGAVQADTEKGREYLVLHTATDSIGIIL